jgi:hypothetical protein
MNDDTYWDLVYDFFPSAFFESTAEGVYTIIKNVNLRLSTIIGELQSLPVAGPSELICRPLYIGPSYARVYWRLPSHVRGFGSNHKDEETENVDSKPEIAILKNLASACDIWSNLLQRE